NRDHPAVRRSLFISSWVGRRGQRWQVRGDKYRKRSGPPTKICRGPNECVCRDTDGHHQKRIQRLVAGLELENFARMEYSGRLNRPLTGHQGAQSKMERICPESPKRVVEPKAHGHRKRYGNHAVLERALGTKPYYSE